jgi:Methyltransferase domain
MVSKLPVAQGLMVTLVLTTLILVLVNKSDLQITRDFYGKVKQLVDVQQFLKEADKAEGSPDCDKNQWKSISADEMTAEQMFQYLHFTNSSACSLTYDFGGIVYGGGSMKGIDGQKTICMDPGVAPDPQDCLVYSFGINNEWSFDKMVEGYGCQVYAFDPSMAMNDSDYTANIHFFKMGLSGSDSGEGSSWKVRTLDSIYKMLEPKHGPKVIDYLKVDIEYAEWASFKQILKSNMLDNVKQIGMEVHFTGDMDVNALRENIRVLKGLEDYGMVRYSSRVNIFMNPKVNLLGRNENTGYEITWFNQKFKKNLS